ncbi:phosphoribosyltransferase family protein [Agromyces sp. SYSU T00194]|uniref:phosphoribosyltransferase family protein n=1 Tax=Agromyces chitinivorans TaxID=3158560 RepID=UPI003394C807
MFDDRIDAGARLAAALRGRAAGEATVLGLPRGGVPVAAVVAEELGMPLDVIVVRKLGLPTQPELAMGAIAEEGVRVIDQGLLNQLGVPVAGVAVVETRERRVLDARHALLRRGREAESLRGRTAIVVDDGLATGATAEAACRAARARGAARVVFAAPVGPQDGARRVPSAHEVVIVETPERFAAVGQAYRDFSPTSEEEVILLLDDARLRTSGAPRRRTLAMRSSDVTVTTRTGGLRGILTVPDEPAGTVLFAHGSGSSRRSPRNRIVAETLQRAGYATLMLDLLSEAEEQHRERVFDIPLLGSRLIGAQEWLHRRPETSRLPIGLFGASTGAGAALWAAGDAGSTVRTVVSRGGRPDLAGPRLGSVHASVLLIVGGADAPTLELNRAAEHVLGERCRLVVVPDATHLFEEPGTLAEVAMLARDWFGRHLAPAQPDARLAGAS